MKPAALAVLCASMSFSANYSVQRVTEAGFEVVRLVDAAHKTEVSIVPSIGNNAYQMKVNGVNVFWFPQSSLAEFKAKPTFSGNPLLAPWANRLDGDGFYANGKRYALDPGLKNYRTDPFRHPIHGLLAYAPEWKVVGVKGDDKSAEVTSRLEFWRYPDYMAQFPFAHTIDMTYRLQDGILEVATRIENHAEQAMPVSVGYHPYFKIHDAPRDQWTVRLAAREQVVLSSELLPTGEKKPMPYANPQTLTGIQLDDVFASLIPGESGRAEFSVRGVKQQISVLYGPKYPIAVVYAPAGRDFICFEPMSGPTNAFNLHHAGKYNDLQTIAPRGVWQESFWIQPSGFSN
jgi:aldose 1-epimerase